MSDRRLHLFAQAALISAPILLAGTLTLPAEGDMPHGGPPVIATFSIVGYDSATGAVGVAVQSRVFSVGNGVIWGKADVGVVATQAVVDVSYGPKALALLEQGLSPAEVVQRILAEDPDPDPKDWPKAGRQFSVMNAKGEVSTYTGPEAPAWSGHHIGRWCSAQGNILAGPEVVDAMAHAFETTGGHLSFRLLAALEAGQAAGGDKRGMQSAAMLIVRKNGGIWLNHDVVLRLQVDDDPQPIAELRRLVEKAAEQREMVEKWRAGQARDAAAPEDSTGR